MDRERMKHINIYNTTEEYNTAKLELYKLGHFIAYNKETNEILTKDIVNITFNITPEDATINYSIDNESYDLIALNGVPILVTYKSTLYYKISKNSYSSISKTLLADNNLIIKHTLSKIADIGDIIVYKNEEFFAVNPNELISEGTPIGIVVIPNSHNIYGDGSCVIMALNAEDHMMGTEYAENPLTNYSNCYYINNKGIAQDWDSVLLFDLKQGSHYTCNLPTDSSNIVKAKQSLDGVRYYETNSYPSTTSLAPSPYNPDGSKNNVYYMEDSQYKNALADINGESNTLILKDFVHEIYMCLAAIYCNLYSTEGTNSGDWFLPAIGELAHLLVNYGAILTAINKIIEVYGEDSVNLLFTTGRINSSTSADMDNFWKASINNYYISNDAGYNTENFSTIPFLKLKL